MKNETDTPCFNCSAPENPARRSALMKMCTGALLGLTAATPHRSHAAEVSDARPETGDLLVRADPEGNTEPLTLADLALGDKPILAFPFDPGSGAIKSGSRLNKVIVFRVAPDDIHEDMRRKCADGVVAYSAVCTHQGCDITNYVAKDNALICFCHFSQFRPTHGGEVIAGPAPRGLPVLPLKVENQRLVVAGKFSSKPGATAV
ncbi:MAG TPA: Rieske (2Fe-2S) protein [Aromatoleum sp.]|uniref:QcrA and Rieske domain-containing protein n=1 Tax=Aromatoleum sp. TaxID=2307007 RepID=UPI002B47FCFF|nr:Rieske (2Fe-2S) protein [Aromatoleum sp.]HJV27317.1 Rieske (2Fe-2S) protein [Aromatoleum sp.]